MTDAATLTVDETATENTGADLMVRKCVHAAWEDCPVPLEILATHVEKIRDESNIATDNLGLA